MIILAVHGTPLVANIEFSFYFHCILLVNVKRIVKELAVLVLNHHNGITFQVVK